MLSIKSISSVAIGLILINQVAAYQGWGDPACSGDSVINGSDCHNALGQFFDTSGVYTSAQAQDSHPKSSGTCTVVLNVPKQGCKVRQEYLLSGKNPKLSELRGQRGGMDYLISKCIDNKMGGEVKIFSDTAFPDQPGTVSCTWDIKITQYKP